MMNEPLMPISISERCCANPDGVLISADSPFGFAFWGYSQVLSQMCEGENAAPSPNLQLQTGSCLTENHSTVP